MNDEIAQRLARVELEVRIDQWRQRARAGDVIAKRGLRIMTLSVIVLVPTLIGGWLAFAMLAIGGAVTAAMCTYGAVLAVFGSLARRSALRALREHGGELPEARIVR